MIETIPHNDNDDITMLLIEFVNLERELNKSPEDLYFIDVEFAQVDVPYASKEVPSPPSLNSEAIEVGKVLRAQLQDSFCTEMRRKRNHRGCRDSKWMTLAFFYARATKQS